MKTENKKIGEHNYTVTQAPGRSTPRLFFSLFNAIGEPLFHELIGIKKKGVESLDDIDKIGLLDWGRTALNILAGLNAAHFDEIVDTLMGPDMVLCDSVALGNARTPGDLYPHLDEHFRGRTMHFFEVVLYVLWVNFADFRDALPLKIGKKSSNESTDESATPAKEKPAA